MKLRLGSANKSTPAPLHDTLCKQITMDARNFRSDKRFDVIDTMGGKIG